MTKQEAIEYGVRWKNAICDRGDTECSEAIQFLNMAIEALQQEPSEDCISREYLKSLGYINKGNFNSVETIREWIDNAPSVLPRRAEPKHGKWIMHPEGKFVGFPHVNYECSECRAIVPEDTEYCPCCGARMKGGDEQ